MVDEIKSGQHAVNVALLGDVVVDREDPKDSFLYTKEILQKFDYVFANIESPMTDDPHLAPSSGLPLYVARHNIEAYSKDFITAASLANNHIVDAGHKAMLETIEMLNSRGIKTAGAGATEEAARKPAVSELKDGTKIGLLAYSSMFPIGYNARGLWPGIAVVRGTETSYSTDSQWISSGQVKRHVSVIDPEDLRKLETDIRSLRESVDFLLVSFHWGDWSKPFEIGDFEKQLARLAIDFGADIIVGHHQHALRGVEIYKQKPIFYGLGHFHFDAQIGAQMAKKFNVWPVNDPENNFGSLGEVAGWPHLPMHRDTRKTVIAGCLIEGAQIKPYLIPCLLGSDGQVYLADLAGDEGIEIKKYINEACESQGLKPPQQKSLFGKQVLIFN